MIDLGHQQRTAMADDSGAWDYWWPRFESLSESFIAKETDWRAGAQTTHTEIKGRIELNILGRPLTITVRADRIDRMRDGSYAVIDYKTSGEYKEKAMITGIQPQLPLEAMIIQKGGFEGLAPAPISYVGYWKLSGGRKGLEEIIIKDPHVLNETIERTSEGILSLLETYARAETAFVCRPDPARAPRYDDYKHLSRYDEWAHDDDNEAEAA